MAKGGSKLVTGIISFLLGFIFAIIVEIGAVFGVYWFVVNSDINTVMATIGLPNTNDRYINTDTENGGVGTVKDLLSGLKGLVYENGEVVALSKSIDDFKNLVPATQLVLDLFYGVVDDYIELDHNEFQSRPMTELAQVLSDSIMNIKTAPFLEKLGMDTVIGDDANPVVKSLLAGAECEYATVKGTELKLPVMYDYYTDDGDSFARIDYNGLARPVNGTSAYPVNLREGGKDWLCNAGTFKDVVDGAEQTSARYALYYVPCRVTASGIEEAEYIVDDYVKEDGDKKYKFQIVKYGEGTDFIAVKPVNGKYEIDFDEVYAAFNSESSGASDRFTGYSYYEPYAANYYYENYNSRIEKYEIKTVSGKNYFRDSRNKMIQLDALTLTDIVLDPFVPLDSVLVTEVVGEDSDVAEIFGTTTLGALLRGEGVDDIINDLEVGTFVENVSPDNKVMCYIAYKISHLRDNGNGTYKAIYDKDGADEKEVTVYLDEKGYISEIAGVDEGVKVKDVAALTKAMPVTVLMDVRADEAVMVYLGYGVTGLQSAEGGDYAYTGKVNIGGEKMNCYVATETVGGVENVIKVWYLDGEGNRVNIGGTKVNDVSDRMNGFTDDLTIGDVLKLDGSENQLLKAIKDTPISHLDDRINEITVDEMFTEEEMSKSAMLRQLRGKKLTELSTAIDELLIQSIYAEEVYGLPEGADLMEVVEFDEAYEYFTLRRTDDEKGGKKGEFVSVGNLTKEQFDSRGSTVYYTYGSDTGDDRKMKIVGFDPTRLYYESNGDGGFIMTEKNSANLPESAEKDNAVGKLTQADYDNRGETKYYTYGDAKGMWRLVLFNNKTEKAYTINNFNNMVNSCADNVYSSTLGELQDAGLITDNIKGKTFKYKVT
ncbi:MAG: hypothetical protein K2O81_05625, partial [Clostridia bacterium]|nr:hypothetical protein [Clostridia bacterium]